MRYMSNYRLFAQAYRRQAWRTCIAYTTTTANTTMTSEAPAAAPAPELLQTA